jgi:hypothetical protein
MNHETNLPGNPTAKFAFESGRNFKDATHCSKFVCEAVDKTIIVNSRIGKHINKTNSWDDWAASGSAYRVAQYNSDNYYNDLSAALKANAGVNGIAITSILVPAGLKSPADPFLAEYNNKDK